MTSSERIYHGAVRGFSIVIAVLGLAILVRTIGAGGGALGLLLGIAFVAVGVGRLYIDKRIGR